MRSFQWTKKEEKKKKKEHRVLKMDHQIQMFNPTRRAYYQGNQSVLGIIMNDQPQPNASESGDERKNG